MSGPADQVHHPFGDRGGAGRDRHPPAVSGQVGVAGGVVARPVAVPAGDEPELVVDAGSGAEDADQRFQQRQVDDLPGAAWRRPGGTARASPRRRRSARRRRRPARTAAGSAARPPRRSGGPARSSPRPGCRTPGAWRTGPVWPNPVTRSTTSAGLIFCSSSGPRPHFSSTPGRKFSITTSAWATSRRRMSWPSGVPKFRVMVRLFRAITFHHRPWPSLVRPWVRAGSPAGVLHLDDVGAPVAEQHRGDRRGVDGAQVQHPQSGEGSVGRRGRGGAGSFGGSGGGRHARLVLLDAGSIASGAWWRGLEIGCGAPVWAPVKPGDGTGGGRFRHRGRWGLLAVRSGYSL